MSVVTTIAKRITDSGIVLEPKHNSIFTAIKEYGPNDELTTAAIKGIVNYVSSNINTYRNMIIPDAKELRGMVKSKTAAVIPDAAKGVQLHILEKEEVVSIMSELDLVYPDAVSDYNKLPENPLLIESKLDDIRRLLRFDNHRLEEAVQSVAVEYSDSDLLALHDKTFSNVSKTNPFIRNLFLEDMHTVNDVTLILAMTIGYINGTMGVSNMPIEKAKTNYLYTLRNITTTILGAYNKRYNAMVSNNVLVVKSIVSGDSNDIYLIDSVYQEYLNSPNADAIVGAAHIDGLSRVKLEDFMVDIDKYVATYESVCKKAAIKASINNINVLRTAYVTSVNNFLDERDDTTLDAIGVSRDSITGIVKLARDYVNGLDDSELMEVTEVTRFLIAVVVYDRGDFMDFSGYMSHYNKIYPKFTVEELATISTVGVVMDVLMPQFNTVEIK